MIRKFIAFIAIFLSISFLPFTAAAEQQTSPPDHYQGSSTKFAVMVSDIPHFKAAIMTAQNWNVSTGKNSFEIVIAGKLAKELVDDPSLKEDINTSEKLGIKLTICDQALIFFKADKSKLDKRIHVVPNAWIHMFELKDAGYNTLST